MAEYIERQAIMDALLYEQYGYLCEDAIKCIPAADVAQVRHGRWIEYGEPDEWRKYQAWYWKCSECGAVGIDEMNYCPNCGARMDGET